MWANDSTMQSEGGYFDESRTASTEEGKESSTRGQNIVPVMIAYITQCNGDLNVWGNTVRIVTFVGIVRSIEQVTTRISYEIEDQTDCITAFSWLEKEKSNIKEPNIETNTYVKVYGFLREQEGKTCVLILRIAPIKEFAELTGHLLEVTYAMLKLEELTGTENAPENKVSTATKSSSNVDDDTSTMTPDEIIIYKLIKSKCDTDCGIERDDIKRQVEARLKPRVDDLIDQLATEGHIYTTSTDDHFKTT
ncbi:replication protein A 32 kDa subunit-A [Orussus abietinus]|uniref:replication protein A 32 kDa subunit-A n=1 Tax=Orussus abietinus TaxID=222816 RepID=UPI0006253183|nr:replication protein A 32 kDa subunit-A [Orussus abietinus]